MAPLKVPAATLNRTVLLVMSGAVKLAARSTTCVPFVARVTLEIGVFTNGPVAAIEPGPGEPEDGKALSVADERNWASEIDCGARPLTVALAPTCCPEPTDTLFTTLTPGGACTPPTVMLPPR